VNKHLYLCHPLVRASPMLQISIIYMIKGKGLSVTWPVGTEGEKTYSSTHS